MADMAFKRSAVRFHINPQFKLKTVRLKEFDDFAFAENFSEKFKACKKGMETHEESAALDIPE